jgi:uncharacterized protein YaaN involved in tellurite resistance
MMKAGTIILILLLPAASVAQNYPGMSEADMQKMEQMQACMEKIDEAKLQEIERRSHQIEAEIEALCAGGKRAEAQEKAMAFGKEMTNDPTMQAMSKCGEMMKGMMPNVPYTDQGKDASGHHVCD